MFFINITHLKQYDLYVLLNMKLTIFFISIHHFYLFHIKLINNNRKPTPIPIFIFYIIINTGPL